MKIQVARGGTASGQPARSSVRVNVPSGTGVFCQYGTVDYWRPSVNLYESDSSFYVCVDLAGMERPAIDVSVKNGVLVISGARSHPRSAWPTEKLSIHLLEIDQGPFCRSVEIPAEVDIEGIRASYTSAGYLWVMLPKRKG